MLYIIILVMPEKKRRITRFWQKVTKDRSFRVHSLCMTIHQCWSAKSGFYIYQGTDKPKMKKEVKFDTEIKSVYHTDKYIGFVLKSKKENGYEICLYNRKGQRTDV